MKPTRILQLGLVYPSVAVFETFIITIPYTTLDDGSLRFDCGREAVFIGNKSRTGFKTHRIVNLDNGVQYIKQLLVLP